MTRAYLPKASPVKFLTLVHELQSKSWFLRDVVLARWQNGVGLEKIRFFLTEIILLLTISKLVSPGDECLGGLR